MLTLTLRIAASSIPITFVAAASMERRGRIHKLFDTSFGQPTADRRNGRRRGVTGSWFVPFEQKQHASGDLRADGRHVVRQDDWYVPYGNMSEENGDSGLFQGRPEYPQRARSFERAGYPTGQEWRNRRPFDAEPYRTEGLALRNVEDEPGDLDWFQDQYQRGFYSEDERLQGRGRGFYEPPASRPQYRSTWHRDHWFDPHNTKPYPPNYRGSRY